MRKRRIGGVEVESLSRQGLEESRGFMHGPHRVEEDVQRELLAHADLRFSSLVVRRVPNGVCLEGVLEADDVAAASSSVCGLARRVAGVQKVLNHLVMRDCGGMLPAKG